jgi:hypothetical protein
VVWRTQLMIISLDLTDNQVNALLQFAVVRIIEDRLEDEIDKEIDKIHINELTDEGPE